MSPRSDGDRDCAEDSRGFRSLLRSLLSGIPWSESARSEETLTLVPPEGRHMSIHNANGKTQVIGHEGDQITDVLAAYPGWHIIMTFDVAETPSGHDKAALIEKRARH